MPNPKSALQSERLKQVAGNHAFTCTPTIQSSEHWCMHLTTAYTCLFHAPQTDLRSSHTNSAECSSIHWTVSYVGNSVHCMRKVAVVT